MKPILASQIRVPLLDLLFKCGRRFGEEIKRMDARSLARCALRSQICSFNT
jgi:hypothetical protein